MLLFGNKDQNKRELSNTQGSGECHDLEVLAPMLDHHCARVGEVGKGDLPVEHFKFQTVSEHLKDI